MGIAPTVTSVEFRVEIGGTYRSRIRCNTPPLPEQQQPLTSFMARRFMLRGNTNVTVPGINVPSWNVSIAAHLDDDDLVVTVVRQWSNSSETIYFRQLFVTLYKMQEDGDRVHDGYRRLQFNPATSRRERSVVFEGYAANRDLTSYLVYVRPGGPVCTGWNNGCPRLYAKLGELLVLTQDAGHGQTS